MIAFTARFLHTTAGNITTAFANKLPCLKTVVLRLLMIPLMYSASACAAHYTIHPGALSAADSAAYDTLLAAQAAIDQTKIENQGKPNDALNTLIQSYNVARESWRSYRAALGAEHKPDTQPQATHTPPDVYYDQLNKNLTDLTHAIRQLEEAK